MVRITVDGKEMDAPADKTIQQFLASEGKHLPGMCYDFERDPYGSCRLCLVEANGKLATACNLKPQERLKIETLTEKICTMRKTALELMLSNHYGDCIGPCQDGCPAHSDVQGYLALIAIGKYHEAVKLMKEKYILPAVLGRVCPAFCEDKCRRNLVEEPIAIRELKRFAADYDLKNPWMPEIRASTGKRIAVVGGGPAGLACAYYLRLMGHGVTIFEAMPQLGGMTRYGIPIYRLPRDVLDRDVATVINTGIEVKTNCSLGKDVDLKELKETHDAVFLGTGAWRSAKMGVEGEALAGVMQGIDFLRKVSMGEKIKTGKNVIVVGGGNTAMDVARTSLRLGSSVTIAYRRSRDEMPANKREVKEAEDEGVNILFMANPVKIHGNGSVKKVELIRMKLGEPDETGRRKPAPIAGSNFFIDADNVMPAIGQSCDEEALKNLGINSKKGKAVADESTLETSIPGVFAGGDMVLGASTVIESIATGRRAAIIIDLYLKGKLTKFKQAITGAITERSKHIADVVADIIYDDDIRSALSEIKPYNHWKNVTEEDYRDEKRIPRAKSILRDAKERAKDFKEVEFCLKENDVKKEVERCMSCGCMDVFECKLKEYSGIYGARQDAFLGEQNRFKLDETHPHISLDSNKCVLCGKCVSLTQEITGEGAVDYAFRGFITRVSPSLGTTLKQAEGENIGDMIDVCPTGAITETLPQPPFVKPGPWRTRKIATVCNGCGLGCEMDLEVYNDMIVRAASKRPSWNNGHICDKGRFERLWERGIEKPMLNGKEVSIEEALAAVKEKMKEPAVILTPDVTQEEALLFKRFAEERGLKIGAIVSEGVSTAGYNDILRAKRILLKADLNKYPVMKILLREIQKNGAEIVEENYDLAVLEAPADELKVPAIVLHEGVNETGLLKLGIKGVPKSGVYLVVGDPKRKLDGFTVVFGKSEYADLMLPYPSWAEREGTVINSMNMELRVNRAREGAGAGKKPLSAVDEFLKKLAGAVR